MPDRERDRATYLVAANTERDMQAMRDEISRLAAEVSDLAGSLRGDISDS